MREKVQKQMPLIEPAGSHAQEKELESISCIIDRMPTICQRVLQDLNKGKIIIRRTGANGMSAEQVLRSAIVMFLFDFTYEELAFHINDSRSLRRFCRVGIADKGFKKSALNKNIKAIAAKTWEAIARDIIGYAKDQGIEKGRKARIDCTVVESDIHPPADSMLLWDCVRVLTRLIQRTKDLAGLGVSFLITRSGPSAGWSLSSMPKENRNEMPPTKTCSTSVTRSLGMPGAVCKRLKTALWPISVVWHSSVKSRIIST